MERKMSMWQYKNDQRELYKRMMKETDPKIKQEHTCQKCGEYTFKSELKKYGMCYADYLISTGEANMTRK